MYADALDGWVLQYERPWWDNGEVIVSISNISAAVEARFPRERTAALRRFCVELIEEIDSYDQRTVSDKN